MVAYIPCLKTGALRSEIVNTEGVTHWMCIPSTKKSIIIFAASTESFPNCPTHDGGFPSSMQVFNSENEIKEWTLSNMNDIHITDIVVIEDGKKSDNKYEISYEPSGHRYIGIIIKKNNIETARTIDNGSGKLIWQDKVE